MKANRSETLADNKPAMGKPELVRSPYGYYHYKPLPSKEELRAYYAQEYYQDPQGSYEASYTDGELQYVKLRANLVYKKLGRLRDLRSNESYLDIGCGEGWFLDHFYKKGHPVKAIDFSQYGLKAFNPHLLPYLEQGDCYETLARLVDAGGRYDAVMLANVIEHVPDPVLLVEDIKKVLSDNGVLMIIAPNDFSPLHKHLLENKVIDEPFWLSYPGHLSYFNKESMENLLKAKGYQLEAVIAENPVDNNLLNKNSNYIREPHKGKNIHYFRVELDNFLGGISEEKLLDMYETLGSMGVGRNLIYFCSKRKEL